MPITAPMTQHRTDPLAAFVAAAAAVSGARHPVPLVATRFDVTLTAGLAVVTTERVFRNTETESIETTITFPLPIRAVLYRLEAVLDGRRLVARSQPQDAARGVYEDAVERGKAAVLHEELLRGIHMLSVAHVAPGAEITVRTEWAMPLSFSGGRGRLRIPLTVGDVYGRAGLADSDALIHGGPVTSASLHVSSDVPAGLVGAALVDGRAEVSLARPIDIEVAPWTPRDLAGRAADGRGVTLRITPDPGAEAPVGVALMVDRSGSMDEACAADRGSPTKHAALAAGLRALAPSLRPGDHVELWEFANDVQQVSGADGADGPARRLAALASRLTPPGGGTEVGAAIAAVAASSRMRDILLVTDGKSHALDVQKLSATGRRLVVVLVGEDSLEARIGHLAAATGGEVFVAAGTDIAEALAAALAALRRPATRPATISGRPARIAVTRSGAAMEACWLEPAGAEPASPAVAAVAAVAAALALPAMDTESATAFSVAEGLVTHLTSLVLVDEAGAAQPGLPATRKIALPTPASAMMAPQPVACAMPSALMHRTAGAMPGAAARKSGVMPALGRLFRRGEGPRHAPPRPTGPLADATALARAIDWDAAPGALSRGDLTGLDAATAAEVRALASLPDVTALAERLGLDPVVLAVAMLASAAAGHSRSAARLAHRVLGRRPDGRVLALLPRLGLGSP
ncbi:MAG: VIT domain-containing protein [Alphaproteobacteria bacterium]